MNRVILGWMLLLFVIALFFGCSEGMSVKGEGSDTDDDTDDDDTGPTDPPPAPLECWRDTSDLSVIVLVWRYKAEDLELVDKFVIKRKGGGSTSFQTIAELEPDTPLKQYQDDSAKCNVNYAYRIYAANAAGESEPCGPIVATRQCEE